jgi:hypothetical protein
MVEDHREDGPVPHAILGNSVASMLWRTFELSELDDLTLLIDSCRDQGIEITTSEEYDAWVENTAND